MKEIEIMPNGNIKFLGVPLGETYNKTCVILSGQGICPKKNFGVYVEGKGNVNRLNTGLSLSFAKRCSIQIETEWTGTRIVQFMIFGIKQKEIIPGDIVNYIKGLANLLKKEYLYSKTESNEVFTIHGERFDMYLIIPLKENGYISLDIQLNKLIQHPANGDYDYKYISELHLDYLKSITSTKTSASKPLLKFSFVELIKKAYIIILSTAAIALGYIFLNNNRYETFKDKRVYMRYDKWKEVYEKYDIPSKTWVDAGKRNGY